MLPLITVKHKNYIWYDVGPTCQVCCLSQGSVDVYYRYYDPLMTNNVTLYQEVFGNPVHVPFTATKSHHSGIGNLYKIVFSRYQYQPGFYELKITNRYGSTRVRFNILYSDAGECQFMVIVYCTVSKFDQSFKYTPAGMIWNTFRHHSVRRSIACHECKL